jgi:hypothetical protein
VDPGIIVAYRTRLLQNPPSKSSLDIWNTHAGRLLEVTSVSAGNDAVAYATGVLETMSTLEDADNEEGPPVLESVVELVLMRMRSGGSPRTDESPLS